jgi:hypothetical protein
MLQVTRLGRLEARTRPSTVPTGTLQDKIGGNENHRVFAASHGHLASEILFDRADGRPVDRVRDPTFRFTHWSAARTSTKVRSEIN